ncbi:hypothetical protein [Acanthopleuribacter pedis]|uniref:Uncharacterized protein n=1 Tax=Acanthopleuribacter pedis TaxID=442870 RepID=A0A8J7U4G0_9BACT|nr:hypothetical protein [Acanthopleuribacter pedis]MBO1319393.1 hypothetical protein [Acanthopleuribacter pedis]
MSPTLQQFRSIAQNQSNQVLQMGHQQKLSVLGRFGHRQVQSIKGSLIPKLSKTEQENNQQVKQQFAKVLSKNFDGLFVLSALQQMGLKSDRPLTTKDVASILEQGKRFQILTPTEVQQHLKSDGFGEQVQHIAKMVREEKQYFKEPPPQKLPKSLAPIAKQVAQNLKNLKTPVTRALLDTVVSQVVTKMLNNQNPNSVGGFPGPSQLLHLKTLPKTTLGIPKPFKSNAPKWVKNLVRLPKLSTQKQGFGLSSIYSKLQKTSSKATYFDRVDLKHKNKNITGQTREWALNFSALKSQLDNPKLTLDQRKIITSRALGYLYKFAEVDNPGKFGWQNHMLGTSAGSYFREGVSQLFSSFKEELENGLGLPKRSAYPVFDRKAIDEVKRQFGFADINKKAIDINNLNDPSVFKNIAAAALKKDGGCFLDISHLIKNIQVPKGLGSDKAAAVGKQIEKVVNQVRKQIRLQVEIQVRQNNPKNTPVRTIDIQTREIMRTITNHTALGGMIRVGDQDLLIVRGFDRFNKNSVEVVAGDVMNHSGHLLGPTHTLESWASLAPNMASMLNRLSQKINDLRLPDWAEFPNPNYQLQTYQDLDDFFKDPHVTKFFGATLNQKAPTYAQTLVPLVHRQMDGLRTSIGKVLSDKNLGGLAQFALNRMAGHMEKALSQVGDMPRFLNDMHLINEELATLIALVKPYDPQSFSKLYEQAAGIKTKKVTVEPRHQFKNGGMHAFNAVLSGVEQLKGRRDLNVVAVKGSYYEESDYVLGKTAHYQKATLDSGDIKGSIQNIRKSLPTGQKLDLFLGEFHHNISASVQKSYKAENLINQVKELYQQNLVSNRFTVAIDTTIAKTDGPEIKAFLEAFADKINKGELNVVFFRSGQKFDMGGNDHYNAGFMVSYNNGNQFKGFNQGSANIGSPSIGNLQGMMHIELTAQKELNNYRKAIMGAHAKLLDPNSSLALPPSLRGTQKMTGNESLMITPNEDLENTVFLDIRSPILNKIPKPKTKTFLTTDPQTQTMRLIESTASRRGLLFAGRPSFGFAHTNTTLIGGQNFRLTLGAVTDQEIKGWRDLFVDFRDVGDLAVGLLKDPVAFRDFLKKASPKLLDLHRALKNQKKSYQFQGSRAQGNLKVVFKGNPQPKEILALAREWNEAGVPWAAEAFLTRLEQLNKNNQLGMVDQIHQLKLSVITEYAAGGMVDQATRLLSHTPMDKPTQSKTAVAVLKQRTFHNAPLSNAEKKTYSTLINMAGADKKGPLAAQPYLVRLAEREIDKDPTWASAQIKDLVQNHAKLKDEDASIRAMELALTFVEKQGDLTGRGAVLKYLADPMNKNPSEKVKGLMRKFLLSLQNPRPNLITAQTHYQQWTKNLPTALASDNPLFHIAMVDNIAVAALNEGKPKVALGAIKNLVTNVNLKNPAAQGEFRKRMVAFVDRLVQQQPNEVKPLLSVLGKSANPLINSMTDADTVKRIFHHLAGNFASAPSLYTPILKAMANSVSPQNYAAINTDLKTLVSKNKNHFENHPELIKRIQDGVVKNALENSDYQTFLDALEQRVRTELDLPPLVQHRKVLKVILPYAMDNLAMDSSFIENRMGRSSNGRDAQVMAPILAEMASRAVAINHDAAAFALITQLITQPDSAEDGITKKVTELLKQVRDREIGTDRLFKKNHFGITSTLIQQLRKRIPKTYGAEGLARLRDQMGDLEKLVAIDPNKKGDPLKKLLIETYFEIAKKAATFRDGAEVVIDVFDHAKALRNKTLQQDFGIRTVQLTKKLGSSKHPNLVQLIQKKAL